MNWTPSTGRVRDAYIRAMRNAFIASAGEHAEEFDRWFAQVNREAAAKAWDEGFDQVAEFEGLYTPADLKRLNPYRSEVTS